MGEVQKAGLFFHPDSFPYEANDIASKGEYLWMGEQLGLSMKEKK